LNSDDGQFEWPDGVRIPDSPGRFQKPGNKGLSLFEVDRSIDCNKHIDIAMFPRPTDDSGTEEVYAYGRLTDQFTNDGHRLSCFWGNPGHAELPVR